MATPETAVIPSDNNNQLRESRAINLWQMVGATKLANQLSAALTSQSLQALQRIRDEKLWDAAGAESFRDFLDHHSGSPMTYDQFNRREKLMESEGPEAFDLLNSVNAPYSVRKMLKGKIEIDGNDIRIDDERVRKDDPEAILNLLVKAHAKLAEKERTIERGKKDVDRLKRKADEAEKRAVVANPTGTPTGQALLTAAGALTQLCEALESAPAEEKTALKDQIFDLMRAKQLDLSVALGDLSKEEVQQAVSADQDISDEDLADLEN